MIPAARLRSRTSLAIGAAASATLIAALLLTPRAPHQVVCAVPAIDDGGVLSARFASRYIHAGEQDIAVTIRMPDAASASRPPVSLAIVIDRSGSMEGAPLANAKAAAARLVDELEPGDAFSVVTYSSSDETVMPMVAATPSNKAAARAAIEGIWDDGSTCISCGVQRGTAELLTTPVRGGVRRMVLISDGQANTGLYEHGELAQLVVDTAARGISVSTVGVGLDFDEVSLMRLADVGHGNYYFVEDTAQLGQMFAQELAGLGRTVGADARLVIEPSAGVRIEAAYGYPLLRDRGQVVVPVADLRAGETRKVVLRAHVDATASTATLDAATLRLHWRRVADGGLEVARANLTAVVTTDAQAVAATIDRDAVSAIEQARTARILEEATTIYERDGVEAANRVLERHKRETQANRYLSAPAAQAIEAASDEAIVNFSKAPPAKAKKAARSTAYELAR